MSPFTTGKGVAEDLFFSHTGDTYEVLKSGSILKITRSKIMVPLESSCHKEYTYESLITYHSKDMTNVKVFEKWVKLQGQGQNFWYQ
jgi:hypothetical protein